MIWKSKRAQSRTVYRALLAGMRYTATAYRDPMRYTAYLVPRYLCFFVPRTASFSFLCTAYRYWQGSTAYRA